ncbi:MULTISPECIES: AAA family ATPase [Rhizobium]|nr:MULTISPECIES: ATP-binding protein [Rhizobium]
MANEEVQLGHNRAADRIRTAIDGQKIVEPTLTRTGNGDAPEGLLVELPAKAGLDRLDLDDRSRSSLLALLTEQKQSGKLLKNGLSPRHKLLLSGPPGNGKTSVAEAVAHDLGYPLYVVSYGSLVGSLLGETNRRIESLFAQARRQPCVLFFDEFEAVGKERADKQETGEMKRAVASLLTQIDTLPSHVVAVAATNHPEMLDRAVWRRFEVKLVLDPPNYSRTIGFLVKQLDLDASLGLIQVLGQCFTNKSFAELKDFTLDVRRRAVLDDIDVHGSLRREIEMRFPELDWPTDDHRPDEAASKARPPKIVRKTERKKTKTSGKQDV